MDRNFLKEKIDKRDKVWTGLGEAANVGEDGQGLQPREPDLQPQVGKT